MRTVRVEHLVLCYVEAVVAGVSLHLLREGAALEAGTCPRALGPRVVYSGRGSLRISIHGMLFSRVWRLFNFCQFPVFNFRAANKITGHLIKRPCNFIRLEFCEI